MIDKIKFKNYKVFKKEQELEIKPITIVIGKNNTGKSAILKLPTLIEGALKSEEIGQVFNLENKGVKISNEYKDLVYGKQFKAIKLKLFQKNITNEDNDNLNTEIFIDSETQEPVIDTWSINNNYNLVHIENDNYSELIRKKKLKVIFKGILPNKIKSEDIQGFKENLPIPLFNLNTDFIGGIRQKAKKNYEINKIKFDYSNFDGKYLYDFLIEDSQTTDKKYLNLVSNWLRDKFEGWELNINIDGYKKDVPAIIELVKDNLKINLSQTGMGISQILPLIIRAYRPCKENTLIIIEEPESHLHPYAHAQLAQLFVDSVKSDKLKSYLIETHSLNFVLRVRRLVAEGKLKKEDIIIYYVDFDEELNESNLKTINVDDGGGVEWWPEGVFGETTNESRAIYNAQLNDLKNVD
ncbi:DUF3696 domain-containing protein [Tenacibaculum ovolyticum]|uniref:DUF3696 domain-containing protein n=1 Tax=Tenacibaculum ovolyticum TaxID=104270 RepID=UPI001F16DB85|nr:DUF3696 domain-containing protein [Tenacibaculum ovolyticum]